MPPTLNLRRPRKRHAIKTALVEMIAKQGLRPGECMPGQVELATHFGTTEVTIHRALAELEEEGVIHRIGGKGTFAGPIPSRLQTRTLCLVLPGEHLDEPSTNPQFWPYVRQLMHACVSAAGTDWRFATVAAPTDSDIPPALADLGSRDIVFFHHTKLPRELLLKLVREGSVPTVAFGLPLPGLDCLTVNHDPVTGVRRMVAHLAGLGYRRLAFVGSGEAWGRHWIEGFRRGLSDYGLPLRDDLLVLGAEGQTQSAGNQAAAELLRRGLPCDAILTDSDMSALGVLDYLRREGVHVPQNVGLMGYDGLDNAVLQPPFLTSLRLPLEQMIRAALAEVDAAGGARSPHKHLSFTGEVVTGQTASKQNPKEGQNRKEHVS
jgi:DNA-binding LacI/PurR family transcriptional regulator